MCPVFISIDELFVDDDSEELVADVYTALGTLDAACPEAVAALGADDLRRLAAAGARWAELGVDPPAEQAALLAAVRRLRHLLERGQGDAD
jgi:hypothetical protein